MGMSLRVGIGIGAGGSLGELTEAFLAAQSYASRSGAESEKTARTSGVVQYLMDESLWDSVEHLYITTKGFNSGAGTTLYDVVAPANGGTDLTVSGAALPTFEGQGVTIGAGDTLTSGAAVVPTTGDYAVLMGLRNPQPNVGQILSQTAGGADAFALSLAADEYTFRPAGATTYNANAVDADSWDNDYQARARGKDTKILLQRTAAGSARVWKDGGINALAPTATTGSVPDAALVIGGGATFELRYLLVLSTTLTEAQYQEIIYRIDTYLAPRSDAYLHPGLAQIDTAGNQVRAYSGGFVDNTARDGYYYMIGQRGRALNASSELVSLEGISLYRSTDLISWEDRGTIIPVDDATMLAAVNAVDTQIEADAVIMGRPKILYNALNAEYVIHMHLTNGSVTSAGAINSYARCGFWTADDIEGPYTFQDAYRPCTRELRDMTTFLDDDGTAYLSWAADDDLGANNERIVIAALDANYYYPADNTVTGYTVIVPTPVEAPVIVKKGSRYFLIASVRNGWTPGVGTMAFVDSDPLAAWTVSGSSPYDSTYEEDEYSFHSQSTHAMEYPAGSGNFVLWTNRHNPNMYKAPQPAHELRNLFLPIQFNAAGTSLTIPYPNHWRPYETPTDIALSAETIEEGNAVGAVIGTISVTDPSPIGLFGPWALSIVADPDAAFQIVGDELQAAVVFDQATQSSYSVTIRATNEGGLSYDEVFSITVTEVAPPASEVDTYGTMRLWLSPRNAGTLFTDEAKTVEATADGAVVAATNSGGAITGTTARTTFAKRPTLQTEVVDQLNGINVLRFHNETSVGSDDGACLETSLSINPATESFTAHAVVKVPPRFTGVDPDLSRTSVVLSQVDGSGTGRNLLQFNDPSGGTGIVVSSALGGSLQNGVTVMTPGDFVVLTLEWDLTTLRIYVNGTLDLSFTPTADAATGLWQIGSNKTGLANFLHTDLAEVDVHQPVLSSADRASVVQRLQTVYGL